MMTSSLLLDTVTVDLDRGPRYVNLWGLEGVELRFVGSSSERVPNLNHERVRRRLETPPEICTDILPFVGILRFRDVNGSPGKWRDVLPGETSQRTGMPHAGKFSRGGQPLSYS